MPVESRQEGSETERWEQPWPHLMSCLLLLFFFVLSLDRRLLPLVVYGCV